MSRFSDLPEFLKEYIHENRWDDFRDIQQRTFEVFDDTDGHILITSSTSSGKTEAAMFPVISSIYNEPVDGIGALYIGPLKALIDDQFERISPMIEKSEIPILGWHGDISSSKKKRLMDDPKGILQITPESLQNVITDHREEASRMFRNLRFIIIDEVHSFMESDRGLQLLCCLKMLSDISGCRPRRIGLSATVADTEKAEEWLSAETGIRTTTVSGERSRLSSVKVEYNIIPASDADTESKDRKRAITQYYKDLFKEVKGYNCIVFTNSRVQAERTSKSLDKIASMHGISGMVSVHHSSVSKEFRKITESDLKDDSKKTVAVATTTLELGIDVGSIDRIVQIDPPFTCSSFLQRMGRSGRRGGTQSMTVFCNDDRDRPWNDVFGISMELVRAIAITELALSGWTESCMTDPLPYGLLFHQTMEYMKSTVGIRFSDLRKDVLSMYPFRNITEEDYKILLRFMWAHGDLKRMDDGTLLIGSKAENLVFHRDFCSVFDSKIESDVFFEGKNIGSIQDVPEIGETIQLIGRTWEIVEIEDDGRRINVEPSDGSGCSSWRSDAPNIQTAVMRKMRDILSSSEDYSYLNETARSNLESFRRCAVSEGILSYVSRQEDSIMVFPWIGTKAFDTLERILKRKFPEKVYVYSPYFVIIRTESDVDEIYGILRKIKGMKGKISLMKNENELYIGKYDRHVPAELLKKAFTENRLDFNIDF